ncbi:hypothetical protein FHR99_000344 [Litorivivens lipolytica]|uniref:Lipoprotein n=1 Tax=Litorivivens lipolytica TaxID=1524264 RepID=A0A7W4W2S9_9GAMM|nr:hypothetical protein [Litorivivens lipolytica]MBB3046108.1 hypothetical protein [Litorivivens lipolytica]
MKSVLSLSLAGFVSLTVLAGCTRQPEPPEPASVDVTDVTDVTSVTTPPASAAATPAPENVDANSASQSSSSEGGVRPVSLNLSLPSEGGSNNDQYLFAEKEQTPNYFQSKSDKPGVKFKGKVYMIDEPSSEKRMDNVDGGEIGIVVPLK